MPTSEGVNHEQLVLVACATLLARRRDWAPSRQPRTRMAAGVPAGRCGRFGVAGIALSDRNAAIPIRRALSSRVSPDRRTGCSARESVDRSGPRRGGGSVFRLAGMDCGHAVVGEDLHIERSQDDGECPTASMPERCTKRAATLRFLAPIDEFLERLKHLCVRLPGAKYTTA